MTTNGSSCSLAIFPDPERCPDGSTFAHRVEGRNLLEFVCYDESVRYVLIWKTTTLISQEQKPTPCPLHLERGKPTHRSIVTIGVRSVTIQAWDKGNAGIHSKPLSRLPQGGEAQTCSNASCIAMESQQTHQPTSPLPTWEAPR